MTGTRRLRVGLASLAVFAVAVALRAGPLHLSPLPFNPDGIMYAGQVQVARVTGSLPLARMPTDDYQFTALLVTASAVLGVPGRYVAQPVVAVVGAVPALYAVSVGRRILRRKGIAAPLPGRAGLCAGALLAVEGLYLHRSMAADEQTLGLTLVPLFAIAVYRARSSRSRAWWAVTAVLALVLPPTHNLDSTVAGLFLLLFLGMALQTRPSRRRAVADALLAGGFWLYVAGYNVAVDRFTPSMIIQEARLLEALDLLLAWVIVAVLALAWGRSARARTQRLAVGGLFGAFFGLLTVNAAVVVFPSMPATAQSLLWLLVPLAVPVAFASWAVPILGERDTQGVALLALAGAPVVLIGLSLTAALTPPYLNTIYRAQTFLHFPVMVAAGIGAVLVIHRWTAGVSTRRTVGALRAIGLAFVIVCAAVSIPVAFAGLDVVPYKGVTQPAELETAGFASRHVDGEWAADDHVGRISRYYAPTTNVSVGAAFVWAQGGAEPACPTASQRSWTTVGAQFYPQPAVTVDASRYDRFVRDRHVVYDAGTADRLVVSLPRRPADRC